MTTCTTYSAEQISFLSELLNFAGGHSEFSAKLEEYCREKDYSLPQCVKDMLSNYALLDNRITSTFSDPWSPTNTSVKLQFGYLPVVNNAISDFISGVLAGLSSN